MDVNSASRLRPYGPARAALLLAIALLVSACMTTPVYLDDATPESGGPAVGGFESSESVSDLMTALEDAGASVQWAGTVSQSFFAVPGWLIRVNGQETEVYEYLDEAARLEDTSRIAADGSRVAEMPVEGTGQPTFWAGGQLIVLFTGDTDEVPNLLTGVLGDPLTRPGAGTEPAIVLETTSTLPSEAESVASESAPPLAPGEVPVLITNVTLVQAASDLKIHDGPGANYSAIGDVFAGQSARVTGVSADGNWWRVICPDGSEGSCWVTGNPKLAKVAATE